MDSNGQKCTIMDMTEEATQVLRESPYFRWHPRMLWPWVMVIIFTIFSLLFSLSLSAPFHFHFPHAYNIAFLKGRRSRRSRCMLHQPPCSNCLPCTGGLGGVGGQIYIREGSKGSVQCHMQKWSWNNDNYQCFKKLAKHRDVLAISKSETIKMTHWLTGVGARKCYRI